MKTTTLLGLALVGLLASVPLAGNAQYQQRGGERVPSFYGGIGGGYYDADGDADNFDINDDNAAWRAYAGVTFIPWLGVEGFYADFGDIGGSGADIDVDGWGLAAVAQWPIGNFAPYLKLGNFWWDRDGSSPFGPGSDNGNDWFGGGGVRFNLASNVDLRVEYARFQFDDVDADSGWIDVQFRF